MKKILLSLIALVALVTVSCGGESKLYQNLSDLLTETEAAVEAATTVEELNTILLDFGAKSMQMAQTAAENGEGMTDEQAKEYEARGMAFGIASAAKKQELAAAEVGIIEEEEVTE